MSGRATGHTRNNMNKTWPFKLMCTFLYGHGTPGVSWMQPGYAAIRMPELCTWLKMPNTRVREHIRTLEEWGMIEDLNLTRGLATFRVVAPPNQPVPE